MAGRGPTRDTSRDARMIEMFRTGRTLQEIGNEYGITRERVRQILARYGITRLDGGIHAQAIANEARREAQRGQSRDGRSLLYYGCTRGELLALNDGMLACVKGSKAERFRNQKNQAMHRGIRWMLTFPQWLGLWNESGKWEQRGLGRDLYCMARVGDTGPYSLGNVYITTCAANVADYQTTLKKRGVVCADGYRRLPERAARMAQQSGS